MRPGSRSRTSQLSRRRLLSPPARLASANRRRRWVLQLWEAFLIQMDDFDRLIEFQLRRRLDPLMTAPVPIRRGRLASGRPATGERGKPDRKPKGGVLVLLENS